ncbi:ATP-dependent Clp protease ATP-binding subunit [[Mycoplasma] mobile]|uniref:ATP-dependent Clp protease, ATPase subunit n=1 Tax=Mycoplasma mobile (strain ATCC 43663 / 163K / NCTC 11711) TaxID=267748 RepID=Q6KHS7_MYCM1|nr:ATP-dependent Clp protease, ATPase subunit [Mycoplasma mobile 163K]
MQMNYKKPDDNDPLKQFGRNLTDLAKKNMLEPVIGREDEIRRIIRILSRKTKNNPVLVGEPGVGKTAIVEGLAKKIHDAQVPEDLKNKEVIEISLPSLIAGASYQGQFEERIKSLMDKIEKNQGKYIIFIDEIHLLIGTGKNSSNSTMDAANIFKPALARGQMQLVGATTIEEYRKYIESDSALERRMQKVKVAEPNIEDTITILRGIKGRFETFHNVKISDKALIAAANLSARYISDRFLPDKAIDLVDEAASTIKTEINSQPEELEKIQQKIITFETEKAALKSENTIQSNLRVEELNNELKKLNSEHKILSEKWISEKNVVIELNDKKRKIESLKHEVSKLQNEGLYEKASKIMYSDLPKIEKELKILENLNKEKNSLIKEDVTENEIAEIVSKWTMIPISKLLEKQKDKLLNLQSELKKQVKGQEEAIELVSDTILRSRANINDPNKPIGSFIFMGPTGVGKTELAKSLAYVLFDSKKQLIRLDMSEYSEKHSISKIIGSPPGYIGYENGGQLTELIRQKPYSIVLFDELEKAHPDVLNVLLQILDDGILTDAKGKTINFKNTIIIMTTNLGSDLILEKVYDPKELRKILLKFVKPEFLNRIDEIIPFKELDKDTIKEIIENELNELEKRVYQNQTIFIKFDDSIVEYISKQGYDNLYGARPLKRVIQNKIQSKIALNIISGNLKPNESYIILIENENLVIKNALVN